MQKEDKWESIPTCGKRNENDRRNGELQER